MRLKPGRLADCTSVVALRCRLVHRGPRLPEPVRLVAQRLEAARPRGLRLHGLAVGSSDVTAIARHLTALTCLELHVAPAAGAASVDENLHLLDLSPLHSLSQLAGFALDLRRLGDKAQQLLALKCVTPSMEAESAAMAEALDTRAARPTAEARQQRQQVRAAWHGRSHAKMLSAAARTPTPAVLLCLTVCAGGAAAAAAAGAGAPMLAIAGAEPHRLRDWHGAHVAGAALAAADGRRAQQRADDRLGLQWAQ